MIIANEAKIRAPVLSGQLRRSIGVSTSTPGGKAEARVGSNLEYARRIEFGFTGADRLGRIFDQPGKPFLRPAAKAKRKQVINEISRAIADKVKGSI
jgi:HK97 gp10 family phage protein